MLEIILSICFVTAAALLITRPFFNGKLSRNNIPENRSTLAQKDAEGKDSEITDLKESLLLQLEELELDFLSGKMAQEDYAEIKCQLVNEVSKLS